MAAWISFLLAVKIAFPPRTCYPANLPPNNTQCVRTLTVDAASLNNLRYEPNIFLHLNARVPVGLFTQVTTNIGKKRNVEKPAETLHVTHTRRGEKAISELLQTQRPVTKAKFRNYDARPWALNE